jgi:hypothetical protein
MTAEHRGLAEDQDGDGPHLGSAAPALAAAALAVARRVSDGATLWCWSPASPAHAQHVAVEFVHPVIVGKRAMPAVALGGPSPVDALRPMARPGDVLVVLGAVADGVTDAVRRARAWGLTTVWFGTGPPSTSVDTDHLIWWDDGGRNGGAHPSHDGRWVLGYHLLWELVHVCFEHPGLLRPSPAGAEVCITCSDEGRLGEVAEVDAEAARVRTADGLESVDTGLVGPVQVHDLVLVHAGVAITVLDDEER